MIARYRRPGSRDTPHPAFGWAAASLVVALLGCSEHRADSTPTPPSSDPVLQLGDERVPIEARTLPAENEQPRLSYEQVRHPSSEARRELARIAELLAQDTRAHDYRQPSCTATLTHPRLVVLTCTGRYRTTGAVGVAWDSTHLAIEGDRVEPFSLTQAFQPDADLEELVRPRCLAEREDPSDCATVAGFVLGESGLRARYVQVFGTSFDIERPYAELRGAIDADGPLGAALGMRVEAPEENAWALCDAGRTEDAMRQWTHLPAGLRDGVALQPIGPALARLVLRRDDDALARRLAESVGATAVRVAITRPATLEPLGLSRARRALFIAADSRTEAILPAGTILLTAGRLDDRNYGAEVRVWTSVAHGTADVRHVERHTGCIPSAPSDASHGQPLVAVVEDGPATLALFHSRSNDTSFISVHPLDTEACEVGLARVRFEESPPAFHVEFVRAERDEGPLLLVSGAFDSPDAARYSARDASGERGAVWESDVPRTPGVGYMVRLGEESEDGAYCPLTYWVASSPPLRRTRWSRGRLIDAESGP